MRPRLRKTTQNNVECPLSVPNAGKGTYGGLLATALGTEVVTAGDILRDHVRRETSVGRAVRRCQSLGRLADDDIVSEAVLSYLAESHDAAISSECSASRSDTSSGTERKVGFILDGFPRTARQVEIMESENSDWPEHLRVHFAVSIDVPDSICVTKMLGRRICAECGGNFNVNDVNEDGFRMPPTLPDPPCPCNRAENWKAREDDTEEIIEKRIADFHSETNPVVARYDATGRLVRFFPYEGVDDMPLLESMVSDYLKEGT